MKILEKLLNGLIVILLIIAVGLFVRRWQQPAPAAVDVDAVQTSQPSQSTQQFSDTPLNDNPIALPDFNPDTAYAEGVARNTKIGTIIPSRPRIEVVSYIVQPGDNLFSIAEVNGLRPETILWGNFEILQDNPQFLRPEQALNILPVDGTYYKWETGDSITSVAEFFGVSEKDILAYPGNRFGELAGSEDVQVEPGTWIIVPGGKRALQDWGPPAITRNNPASAAYYGAGYCGQIYEGAVGTNVFVWPTVSRTISGYDYLPNVHPGLDIGGPEGNAVYATDSGVVVYSGWSEYGYGFLIVLDHGNGWQSAYAHLSGVGVSCGQSVAQGTVIGAVGNTGNSTGPHLHFELRSDIYGKVNPWNFVLP